jgi:ubiquinone/menaquinone biosynthesis C-methylase UbiE
LGETITGLFPSTHPGTRALDVGCGDMTIAETISARNRSIAWTCTDIHELPHHLRDSEKWEKYRTFDGRSLPFEADSFDVVLFSDVLHHCLPNAEALLREAARVGRFVVIKDHFEYGWYSRQMLRLLDFVGNYGYGVELPKKYFSQESFRQTFRQAGLVEHTTLNNLDLYSGMPFLRWFLGKSWQFIAVLQRP